MFDEWLRRRRSGDPKATVANLYELVAAARGLRPEEMPASDRDELSRRALPEMAAGFEFVPGSERGLERIELVPYDATWPERFDVWKSALHAVLSPRPRRIDHVGSTAVPGMTAKPVIDIQVSVAQLANEASYVPAIESLGVQLRSRDDDHRYFRPFSGRPRDVHIHVCTTNSLWERRHLLFVAFLRTNASARQDYARVKEAAAQRWGDDRVAYTEAKDGVIAAITERAEAWANETSWSPDQT